MRHYTKDDMFPKYWWVDADTCEAGVIKEFFPDVKIILDAFHLLKRYGDSTVGSQHPLHNGEFLFCFYYTPLLQC